ncbi:MAG: SDR family oxidoreductase [Bacteroidales bacterium]|nr:SDR family oxidoreductase [Bacteroidales bacterium]
MPTLFITGGATGIGRATAKKFIQRQWNVAFMDLNAEESWSLLRETDARERLLFVEGDTRIRENIRNAVDQTLSHFGTLDSVFANAGIHRSNTLLSISDEELHLMINTNIYGTVNTLRETVPALIQAGGGSIVINCSDQWFIGKPNNFAYGLTKGALGQITRSLSIDLAPHRIRVNAVCPASIHTPLLDKALLLSSQRNNIPLERLYTEENADYARGVMGTPEEVASLVYFLASPESSFCTGAHYLVDGGLVAK